MALAFAAFHVGYSRAETRPARPSQTEVPTACHPSEPAGEGRIATVIDGRSFVLTDGREIRLAGIEVPFQRPGPPGNGQPDPGLAARSKLESMLSGATVALSPARPGSDRYGRTLAYVDVVADGTRRPVAAAMVAAGFARVAAHVETMACALELRSQERAARANKLGLWAEPYYVIFEAGNGAALLGHQGQFTIVEGKVISVRTSGGVIYLNFGRKWTEALTVTIQKRHERIFSGAGIVPGLLENRRVRVRGWIEERSGPRMEATRPEQIEIAELM